VALDDAAQRARLREAILQYTHRCPLAADTVDGILACWLPHPGFEDAPEHIAAVLGDMVANRWLHVQQLPDGKTLFYVRSEAADKFGDAPEPAPAVPNPGGE